MGRLDNIYNQTFQNWELLLVDDGSTDETPKLIDEEATRDLRVRAFHKPNGGAGSARNMAIDNARGEYICAFDIDDDLKTDMLEYCVTEMDSRQVDMLVFGLEVHELYINKVFNYSFGDIQINSNKELRDNYLDHFLFVPGGSNGYFCNKCYRLSFLNEYHLRFENQRIQQDEVFNLLVYRYLERCYISPRIFYIYYVYGSGNTRSRFIPDRYEIYKSIYQHFRLLQEHWLLKDQRFEEYLQRRIYANLHELLRFNLIHPKSTWTRTEKLAEINRVLADSEYSDAMTATVNAKKNIENWLLEWAYRMRSIIAIKFLNEGFAIMRKIYHYIR